MALWHTVSRDEPVNPLLPGVRIALGAAQRSHIPCSCFWERVGFSLSGAPSAWPVLLHPLTSCQTCYTEWRRRTVSCFSGAIVADRRRVARGGRPRPCATNRPSGWRTSSPNSLPCVGEPHRNRTGGQADALPQSDYSRVVGQCLVIGPKARTRRVPIGVLLHALRHCMTAVPIRWLAARLWAGACPPTRRVVSTPLPTAAVHTPETHPRADHCCRFSEHPAL